MIIVLEALFVLLVVADTVLTYMCIRSGKGIEAGFPKWYINNLPVTIGITALGTAVIILLTWETPILLLIPTAAFGYACVHNWRVWHG